MQPQYIREETVHLFLSQSSLFLSLSLSITTECSETLISLAWWWKESIVGKRLSY